MAENFGRIVGVNGNLLTVEFSKPVFQNETGFAVSGDLRLKSEVVRIRGDYAELQVFEDSAGLKVGDRVEFTDELLVAELGPGLLAQVFDGLQNPLSDVAEAHGFFLKRGTYFRPLSRDKTWSFTPEAAEGDRLRSGETLGTVPEGLFSHRIMAPFDLKGASTVSWIAEAGEYTVEEPIARLSGEKEEEREVSMIQHWPVKIPIKAYSERLRPSQPLNTKIRIIDTFFSIAKGGTYCIPGPFGAGKTVIQQLTSRHADVDVVVVAACGERAGEVVETIREFPEIEDPRTGKSLMERTIIVCNTSSMPVAAREASVYTGVTLAEYYRQMGLDVLLLADSTSRWAQALREVSGRLEEIPGEEAFPAYLESVIAAFYERSGQVRLRDGNLGSVTIGGTVSPAGGNFEEPVTQSTLKVVGAFHGLSRARSDARRYPAIEPMESWTTYPGVVDEDLVDMARSILTQSNEISQMMKVIGEEGTTLEDYVIYLKGEFLDRVYLQQDAFDPVDGATSAERQKYVFDRMVSLLKQEMRFQNKDEARAFFQNLTQAAIDWNRTDMDSDQFQEKQKQLEDMAAEVLEYA
ncbi:MAG: V-type ATP synthase subunit A [Desulfohalobiaceae bacterium]|nr:V-type ATP synthase subunit A [Desulfohalobiaceae bacterium]